MPPFPAIIELSSLDGSNGFKINGEALGNATGASVSSAGDVNGDGFDDLIIGATGADPNGSSSGSSYVVFGKASGFGATLELASLDGSNGFEIHGVSAGDLSGGSVSGAGDVNGDGFADLIIGAIGADPNGDWSGSTYVVFGKASGFPANLELSSLNGSNGFQINGEAAQLISGASVSSAGDVNGDGFADLLLCAEGYYVSCFSYVVFGKASGFGATIELSSLDGTSGFRINPEGAFLYNPGSVASPGDVNGDGFADLIIGTADANPNGPGSGASYVVFGKAAGFGAAVELASLNGSNGFKLSGVAAADLSGWSVSGAGDVNGDGFADLIIGAIGADPNGDWSGSTYVVFGKASGFPANLQLSSLDGSNGFRIDGETMDDTSGRSVSSAGDINDDGFADLLIGATGAYPNGDWSGSTYVVFGKASGFGATLELASLDGSNGFEIHGVAAGDLSGESVFGAGDVNGDGFDDLLIGAPGAEPNGTGAAYILFGHATDAGVNLTGTNAAETLAGGDFSDTLSGLGGNDVLQGGAGNDYLDGGVGFDVASYANAPGGVNVNLNIAGAQNVGGGAGSDALVGIEYLIGSNFGDTLIGNGINNYLSGGEGSDYLLGGGGDDYLTGGGGNDYLLAGAGDDYLTGGAGFDVASYADASGSVSVDLNIIGDQNVGGGAGSDALVDVEYLIGSSFGDTLIGNAINNYLSGLAGNDVLQGGAGDDYLVGGAGNDTLNGDAGNDILQGGADDDYLTGGAGFDVGSYADASGGVSVNLNIIGDQSVGGGAGTDALVDVEYLIGSNFGDTLVGNGINNYLSSGAGNDVLQGGGGDDYLVGGAGNDTLSGGTGSDIFAFSAASEGGDTITDFLHGTDKIDLAAIDAGILLFQAGATTSVAAHSVNWYETGGNTIVQADVNGNTTADFQITLLGTGLGLTAADFIL